MDVGANQRLSRYARHLVLARVGEAGQRKLAKANVLVVGAGGLGSAVLLYLAAAGVGTEGELGIADSDVLEESNLQRQVAHRQSDIGRPKVESAADTVKAINPALKVRTWPVRVDPQTAPKLVEGYDVVVDAMDNIAGRLALNDACVAAGVPMVHGAATAWSGQAMTVVPGSGGPCYRCLFGGMSDDGLGPFAPRQAGVLSTVPGAVGCIEATEALKLILGASHEELLVGRLLVWDAWRMKFCEVAVEADSQCLCRRGRQ
ncbi:MAG: HesA/MoeB/ThiF family protein [Bacillota bacterium]|nr:HesA/MoeB/ThiF family protein [Bacillota bacterium]